MNLDTATATRTTGDLVQDVPLRLLLVDDATELRGLLRRLLERSGKITVVGEANDVAEATVLTHELHPDALVLDLAMPGGGALELIEELREAGENLTVVILSGYPAATTADQCVSRGADIYLEKGLPTRDLVDAILAAHAGRRTRT